MQAGKPVVATRYLGMIHDSLMLNAIAQAAPAREEIAQINQIVRDVFNRK
jgi:acetyl esterase